MNSCNGLINVIKRLIVCIVMTISLKPDSYSTSPKKNIQFRLQITEFGFIQGLVTGAEVADREDSLCHSITTKVIKFSSCYNTLISCMGMSLKPSCVDSFI